MADWINGERIELGVCYYPEHWPESMWAEDIDRMLEAGLGTVRVAEFAWSKVEPEEDVFTYDFFDRFLDLCEEKGMKVIFCTPTATPPAWLTEKYPEVLNADVNGQLYRHGLRRHCNMNSPVMRSFSRRITEAFASHYGPHPAVVGWQLDNEFNCETNEYYAQADDDAFRAWCMGKYADLDALNRAWGTVFWNQTYTDWSQVHLPRKTYGGTINPHLHLDYLRFISDTVASFALEQADIIRKYRKSGDFITTNGIFGRVDYNQLMDESLDVLTYDSYPNFAYCLDSGSDGQGMKDRKWSRNLAEVRASCPHFGIMEQQSGANGWTTRMEAPTPRPGQLTLWTMQSIAHGADYVSYFRWRTATFGTEIYWHGILDYSGRENRRLREVRQAAKSVEKLKPLAGASHVARVGILKTRDNVLHAETDAWHNRLERQSQPALFAALQKTHTPFDYIYLRDKEDMAETLSNYDVLFAPHLCILTDWQVQLLTRYAEQGGKLIFGARTAYKDIHGQCVMDKLPGLAAPLAGVDIPEYSFVPPDEAPSMLRWNGKELETPVFNELLEVCPGTEPVGAYSRGYIAGSTALTRRTVGEGEVWYLGAAFSEEMVRCLLTQLGAASPWREVITLPEDCELTVREKNGKAWLFVLNYMKDSRKITLACPMTDLLTGRTISGEAELPGYGVMVLG